MRQTYLALKNKLVGGRGFHTYKRTEKNKEQKEANVFTKTGDDNVHFIEKEDKRVLLITNVNQILHSIFSNSELYINTHLIYNSNGFHAQKTYISNNFKSTLTDYKGVLHCDGYDYEEHPENRNESPFLQEE